MANTRQLESFHRQSSVLAIMVAAVLLRSSVVHLGNNFAFLASVYSYDLVSPFWGLAIAGGLPCLQLALGIAILFCPRMRQDAIACAALLFLVFTVVQIITVSRGLNISCGCFGSSQDNPIGLKSIAIAVGCLIATAFAWWKQHARQKNLVSPA